MFISDEANRIDWLAVSARAAGGLLLSALPWVVGCDGLDEIICLEDANVAKVAFVLVHKTPLASDAKRILVTITDTKKNRSAR